MTNLPTTIKLIRDFLDQHPEGNTNKDWRHCDQEFEFIKMNPDSATDKIRILRKMKPELKRLGFDLDEHDKWGHN